ncbi:MAG: dTMP kinase [Rhodospirillales bacterium]|nr:dTMP kinase [Rhodospirillales bacterium]
MVSAPPAAGRFITFEGGEGGGKSTQVARLADALSRAGVPVLRTREPGGAPGAEAIRQLLVSGDTARWDAVGEALLVSAARRDHLVTTILPALAAGTWVVCDRFADSTMAYQGYAGGADRAALAALYHLVAGDVVPDLTLILDLPVATGLARARTRAASGEDRFERMGTEFHEKLRAGFLEIARNEPDRCVVIDATASVDEVHTAVLSTVRKRFGLP